MKVCKGAKWPTKPLDGSLEKWWEGGKRGGVLWGRGWVGGWGGLGHN